MGLRSQRFHGKMTNSQIGSLLFLLFFFISFAHLLGYFFVRLRQPRVIGEILAGIILGPSLLGRLAAPHSFQLPTLPNLVHENEAVLTFIYQLGLLLLMFISGIETRHLFGRKERRQVGLLVGLGTVIPFLVALATVSWLPLDRLMGRAGGRIPLVLVIGIGVSVTSIPVISRIFYDLKILHTRFARLVLGVAVIEDIGLWAVLAVATALAASGSLPERKIALHVAAALIYFAAGITLAPVILKRLARARWNVMASFSPVGYVLLVLLAYSALAAILDVSLVFAAFLAGFAIAADGQRFSSALDSIEKFSFAVFIPLYFALVGYRLDLGQSFSLRMLGVYLAAACVLKLAAVSLGARAAGYSGLANFNLAVAMNARGGPGIVLATVAFEAGIVNASFFTTLVLTAVLTSQAAGAWLDFVLRKGWPLLSAKEEAVALMAGTQPNELAA
jgi:Kef-type K+ transport system membrane component KefB